MEIIEKNMKNKRNILVLTTFQPMMTYLKLIENLRFFHILLILVEYPEIGKLKSQNVIAYETPFISKAERGKR